MRIEFRTAADYGKLGGRGEHRWQDQAGELIPPSVRADAEQLTMICGEIERTSVVLKRFGDAWWVLRAQLETATDSTGRAHFTATVAQISTALQSADFPTLLEVVRAQRPNAAGFLQGIETELSFSEVVAPDVWRAIFQIWFQGGSASVSSLERAVAVLVRAGLENVDWIAVFGGKSPRRVYEGTSLVVAHTVPSGEPAESPPLLNQFLQLVAQANGESQGRLLARVAPCDRPAALRLLSGEKPTMTELAQFSWQSRSTLLESPALVPVLIQTIPETQWGTWLLSPAFRIEQLRFLSQSQVLQFERSIVQRLASQVDGSFATVRTLAEVLPETLNYDRLKMLVPLECRQSLEALERKSGDANAAPLDQMLRELPGEMTSQVIPTTVLACGTRCGSSAARSALGKRLVEDGLALETVRYLFGEGTVERNAPQLRQRLAVAAFPAFQIDRILEGFLQSQAGDRSYWSAAIREGLSCGEISPHELLELAVRRRSYELASLCNLQLAQFLKRDEQSLSLPPPQWHPAFDSLIREDLRELMADDGAEPSGLQGNVFQRLGPDPYSADLLAWREELFNWLQRRQDDDEMANLVTRMRNFFSRSKSEPLPPRKLGLFRRMTSRGEVLAQIAVWSTVAPNPDSLRSLTLLCNSPRLSQLEQIWLRSLLLEWGEVGPLPDSFAAADLATILTIRNVDPMSVLRLCLRREASRNTPALLEALLDKLRISLPPPTPLPAHIVQQHRDWIARLRELPGWHDIVIDSTTNFSDSQTAPYAANAR
ncbi:hypothetical protein LOC68_01720 [Blastopirellula sp. JC732]|uniref:Uncharacterized protein n=1 Tax=Blastopirellula sediminis TaxID=2894196 RepID=A0A9X1MHD6_9BACT|nr:hypothetical protein [Blastopirellula sediminis]MCC9608094.1 hypothetical protein [Blastopirellula sediminis]MCC9627113.1 hypothetical protein [Blastopirellula sediminis]